MTRGWRQPCRPENHDRVTGFWMCILKQHLPCRDRYDRNRRSFKAAYTSWFRGNHVGGCNRKLRIGSNKLRVRHAVHFITALELAHAWSDHFHDTRQVRAERQRWWWADLATAFTNDRIPRSYACCGDPNQNLSCRWARARNVLDDNHVWWTKAVNAGGFHLPMLPSSDGEAVTDGCPDWSL